MQKNRSELVDKKLKNSKTCFSERHYAKELCELCINKYLALAKLPYFKNNLGKYPKKRKLIEATSESVIIKKAKLSINRRPKKNFRFQLRNISTSGYLYECDCILASFYHTLWRSPVKFLSQGQSKRTCQLCLHIILYVERPARSLNTNFLLLHKSNVNENNDNLTSIWSPNSQIDPSAENFSPKKHPLPVPSNLWLKQSEQKSLQKQSKQTICEEDRLESLAILKQHSLTNSFPRVNALEKSSSAVSNSNNKRRYSCKPLQSRQKLKSKTEKELNKFNFEGKFQSGSYNSPPSRIPRFFRRSQSAFCDARQAVEADESLLGKPVSHCYRRYYSWSNESGKRVTNKTFSEFSDFHFINSPPEFNSNANATPHKQTLPGKNFCVLPTPHWVSNNYFVHQRSAEQAEKNSSNVLKTGHKNRFLLKDESVTESLGYKRLSGSSSTPSLNYTYQPDFAEALEIWSSSKSAKSSDLSPGEKDIENLARLKVDGSSICTCKKLQENCIELASTRISGNKTDCENQKAINKDCNCSRIRNQNFIENRKDISRLPLFTDYLSRNKKGSSKLSKSVSFFNEQFPKANRKYNSLVEAAESGRSSKDFSISSPAYPLSASQNKQLQLSSINNHNVKKEVGVCVVEKQSRKTGNCAGVQFIFDSSHSFPSKLEAFTLLKESNVNQVSTSRKSPSSLCFEQKLSDMGCIQSVSQKKKVEPCRNSIYSDVRASIDQSPTIIEEYSPIVLRYRTPYFRAHAQVIMPPIPNKETWTVGWIQACDYMTFINQYGDLGHSSWEIPALKANKVPAVSDSDGVSYPWYGNTTEIATIVGPTDSYTRMNLTMNDNFYPSVTWDIPVSEGTNAHLTKIVRDQSFITWLAAINETTKEIIILKTVRWSFYLEIKIDPTKELGYRARVVTPPIQNQPSITNGPCEKHNVGAAVKMRRRATANNSNSNCISHIPMSALVRPSANNAQTLVWRPNNSPPIVVVPAKEEHKETNELVLFNGCSAMHGKEAIMKEISKQELVQMQQLAR